MKKHRKLLLVMAIVMSLVFMTGTTIAYLQDTDSAVNVMTLGSVEIEQLEMERIEQSDSLTGSDNLQDFNNRKPLLPAVYEGDDPTLLLNASSEQQWPEWGSSPLWSAAEVKNAVDKFVFVKNTGKSSAYVRTWIAFEQGSMTAQELMDVIAYSTGEGWVETASYADAVIEDRHYYVVCMVYMGTDAKHQGGILPSGETTLPSLLQVLFRKTATNEDMQALDGNANGTYDILVFSQAGQSAGFEPTAAEQNEQSVYSMRSLARDGQAPEVFPAAAALDAMFGKDIPWEDGSIDWPEEEDDEPFIEPEISEDGFYVVTSAAELSRLACNAHNAGAPVRIRLGANLESNRDDEMLMLDTGANVTLDLYGHTIKYTEPYCNFIFLSSGAELAIIDSRGNGAINTTSGIITNNGKVTIFDGSFSAKTSLIENGGEMILKGGTYAGVGSMHNGTVGRLTIEQCTILIGNERHGLANDGTLIINDCNISGSCQDGIANYGHMTLNGGYVAGEMPDFGNGISNYSGGTCVVNDGTVYGSVYGISNYGSLTVNGGNISGGRQDIIHR